MTENDPKDSVQKEQFIENENTNELINSEQEEVTNEQASLNSKSETPLQDKEFDSENITEDVDKATTAMDSENETSVTIEEVNEELPPTKVDFKSNEVVVQENLESTKDKTVSIAEEKELTEITSESKVSESIVNEADITPPTTSATEKKVNHEQESTEKLPKLADIDFTKYSKEELIDTLRKYISDYPIENIKEHVEAIKSNFYRIHNKEIEDIHKKFIDEGGTPEDFKIEDSPVELNMKELLNIFRDRKHEISKTIEIEKETNLEAKYEIIEAIKELINSQESLNKTFQDFRNLQERWREIGPVPQKNVKDLWESYHYHVEAFYDYIKINKELRDLDFKKNLDAKVVLCEKAEELIIEPSVVEAFRNLQILHDQWREIGPVPADKRSELWERFRDATSKINHRHQEYFVNLKDEQKNNLKEKTLLCEKAEDIAETEIKNAKDWESKSHELIDLQKIWKTIGFAPKKYNTKIYERFRAACDKFFDRKRDFFAQNREEQENNLQLKTELCIQAEALKDSTDWRKTTDELIKLQKRWKVIGPVPIKQSDKIWKRFRAACDNFFNNKSKFFENIDSKYEVNLKKKEELIKKIADYSPSDDVNNNLEQLKNFQSEWAEIGFVPIKQKDEIQERFREAINIKFDELKIDDERKSLLKFRSRVENIVSKPNSDKRLTMERDKCYNKLKQLESDIILWENNIGFFSNSKNAESLISDVKQKIQNAKEKIVTLKQKINFIDEMD